MKNEKGVTLIELLAAVTISAFIVGVGSLAFFWLYGVFNNSSQTYADNSRERSAIDTLTRYVMDTSKGADVLLPNDKELRLHTKNYGMVLFRYETINGINKLNLYQITNNDINNPAANVQQTIADNLSESAAVQVFELQNDQVIVNLPFIYNRVGTLNQTSTYPVTRTTRISLLKY